MICMLIDIRLGEQRSSQVVFMTGMILECVQMYIQMMYSSIIRSRATIVMHDDLRR